VSVGWKETCPVNERVRFVSAWEAEWNECEGRVNMAALCRAFGVSRGAGYKWLGRFDAEGAVGLEDKGALVRRRFPTWGARKLLAWRAESERGWRSAAARGPGAVRSV
jgi:transposase-like protein